MERWGAPAASRLGAWEHGGCVWSSAGDTERGIHRWIGWRASGSEDDKASAPSAEGVLVVGGGSLGEEWWARQRQMDRGRGRE